MQNTLSNQVKDNPDCETTPLFQDQSSEKDWKLKFALLQEFLLMLFRENLELNQ